MTQSFTQVKIGLPLPSSHFGRFSPTKGGFPVWWLLLAGRRSGDARPATWMTRKLSASTGESPPPSLSAGRCHLPRENCILAFPPYLIPSDLGSFPTVCMPRQSGGDKNLPPSLTSSSALNPCTLLSKTKPPPQKLPIRGVNCIIQNILMGEKCNQSQTIWMGAF